jgi:hypothetical protein
MNAACCSCTAPTREIGQQKTDDSRLGSGSVKGYFRAAPARALTIERSRRAFVLH